MDFGVSAHNVCSNWYQVRIQSKLCPVTVGASYLVQLQANSGEVPKVVKSLFPFPLSWRQCGFHLGKENVHIMATPPYAADNPPLVLIKAPLTEITHAAQETQSPGMNRDAAEVP